MRRRDTEAADRHSADCDEYRRTIEQLERLLRDTQSDNEALKEERGRLLREKAAIQHTIMQFDSQVEHSAAHDDFVTSDYTSQFAGSGGSGLHPSMLRSHSNSTSPVGLHASRHSDSQLHSQSAHHTLTSSRGSTTTQVQSAEAGGSLDGDIMGGFEKLLKERRRLRRTCSSQLLCILSLRLLLKDAESSRNSAELKSPTTVVRNTK